MVNRENIRKALKFIKQHGLKAFLAACFFAFVVTDGLKAEYIWHIHKVHDQEYQHLSKEERFKLIRSGVIKTELEAVKKNKIMTSLKTAIINQHRGLGGAADDLQIDYLALGTGDANQTTGTAPDPSNTQLNNEYFRVAPSEIYQSNSTCVVLAYLEATDANPPSTTVASGASTTVFDVQPGQGENFTAGDRIRVFQSIYTSVTVQSVSTDTITLKSSTPLPSTPSSGDLVEIMPAELMLFMGAATGTANSGTAVNHASLEFAKNSSTSVLVEVHLNYITA